MDATALQAQMPFPVSIEEINPQEWPAPTKTEDEQFYIAMRWPYVPNVSEAYKEKFVKKYFNSMSKNDLVGTAKDYKDCNVLVYNPSNNIAVVCKPAYFLWDEQKSDFIVPSSNALANEEVQTIVDFRTDELSIDAVVSPDAAFFLGILANQDAVYSNTKGQFFYGPNYNDVPIPQECYFAFVPNDVPLGVATSAFVPIKQFKIKNGQDASNDFVIGFGNYENETELTAIAVGEETDDALYRKYPHLRTAPEAKNSLNEYAAAASTKEYNYTYGGNYKSYFQKALRPITEKDFDEQGNFLDPVGKQAGLDLLNQDGAQSGDTNTGQFNSEYTPVFTIADPISIEARKYYEEDYDIGVSVITGNGRSLEEAQEIWNQFRSSYHTYESVKTIFMDTYGLNPEDEKEFPAEIKAIFGSTSQNADNIFQKFKDSLGSANDEFSILLGSNQNIVAKSSLAIEFARRNFIDVSSVSDNDNRGLIEYFNRLLSEKIRTFKNNFLENNSSLIKEIAELPENQTEVINTPRQLFLLMVGLFRQKMWQDPYARAWLVLKPSKKIGVGFGAWGDQWDFRGVDRIFAAFINPQATYAKPGSGAEFKKLLYNNKSQGSDSGNIFSRTVSAVDNFWDRTIGVLFSSMGAALQGLISMFQLNMLQTGYGLSEIGSMSKQANILNKSLNDSIYYSLGRPGSLLRAVDNPFTREYAEPVVEVREPFQRMHYLSSFSHILSNQIKETNFNVATVITAVSDGKYPVTVALDKGAPADRLIESTVETGIFFDNPIGDGFLGWMHPLLHPFETTRGLTKNLTGSPDELLAKRIALSHLKDNIKDIYGGELLLIGNPDIRPHDLVYLADVYERMYGIFEVEQVVHHFTSELGFVTSITPNALVTVNDPAKWYMTSWVHSWMNTQAIRNDTRLFLNSVQASNSGISNGGNISIERLGDNLMPQMTGGIQYTHGASAIIKDTMAAMTYNGFSDNPTLSDAVKRQAQINGNNGNLGGTATLLAISQTIPIFGNLIWKGWQWVRDNLLDQHGAYVQYLNKNGQPMDAGLSYNQGMVVGRYHSKTLLPGILGLRRRTRTIDGHAYIRTDDLLKNLGWNEVEIKELVRYISYENAMVHARVLDLSGLGPEKTGFEPFFKVICKLERIIDGDTIEVIDIMNGSKFKVRFDGINTPEKAIISSQYEVTSGETNPETLIDITPTNTAGYGATKFTEQALENKIFILRIKYDSRGNVSVDQSEEELYDPGSSFSSSQKYLKDIYNRVLATIFYKVPEETLSTIKSSVSLIFSQNDYNIEKIKQVFAKNVSETSFLRNANAYKSLFDGIKNTPDYTIGTPGAGSLNTIELKQLYSKFVEMKKIESLYFSSSKWPLVLWDEYYNDGTPYTLNWELVVNNLANVYVKDVQREADSVITAKDSAAIPTKVIVRPGNNPYGN